MNKIHILLLVGLLVPSINAQSQVSPEISKLYAQKQFQQVIDEIDQNLIKSSNDPELLFVKAQSQSRLKQIQNSINTYLILIDAYPDLPEPYNNLAALYSKQGKLELAVKTLKRGLATTEIYLTLHQNINKIHFEMARNSYGKALGLVENKDKIKLSQIKENKLNKNNIVKNNNSKNNNRTQYSELEKKENTLKNFRVTTKVNGSKYKGSNSVIPKAPSRVKKKVVKVWNEAVISPKDEIMTALQGWAAAWSAQDFNLYLSFYSKAFLPEDGQSKINWKSGRQSRLIRPKWIEVRLSNFIFSNQTETRAEVYVTQIYRSNNFRDKSKKKILLQRSVDGWQILSEMSLQE